MSDRFKFRFWRKNYEGKWIPEYPDLMSVDGLALPYDNGEGGAYNTYDDVVIEQCTGLRDKNGKLIFEGDIVEYSDDYWIVFYNIPRMEIGLMGSDYTIYGRDIKKFDIDIVSCEIIGNIHENPKLLEQSNDD